MLTDGEMEDLEREGFHNYLRLTLLLNEGTRILQQTFREEYKQLNGGQEWEDGSACGENFSENLGKKYFSQAQKIQRNFIKKGNVSEWDISMLCMIFDTVDFEADGQQISLPDRNLLVQLREFRNKHAHLADVKISPVVTKSEFPALWTELSGIVVSLGGDKSLVDLIRTAKELSGVTFEQPGSTAVLSPENQERLRKLKEEGSSAVARGDLEVAIGKYTLALNLFGLSDVERGNLLSNRSFVRLKLYKEKKAENGTTDDKELLMLYDGALEDARKVIELRPNWWEGYARVGFMFHAKGEWTSAIVLLNQALALSPGQTEVTEIRYACLYEAHHEKIEQHLDPKGMPSSRQESIDKATRELPSAHRPQQTAKSLTKKNKKWIKSKVPELRARAFVFFGHHHLTGIDAKKDYKLAANFFSKASFLGNAEGIYNLGLLCQRGDGVARNFARAIELFEQAAAKPPKIKSTGMWDIGVAAAEYALGQAYEREFGKPIDYVKAAEWYQKSSNHGVSFADNNLAIMYMEGRGVEKSLVKAIQYWELSANRGNVLAMHTLANIFLESRDADKAEMWFNRALEGDDVRAALKKSKFEEDLKKIRECPGNGIMIDFPIDFASFLMIPEFAAPTISNNFWSMADELPMVSSQNGDNLDDSPQDISEPDNPAKAEFIKTQLTHPKRLEVVRSHREEILRIRKMKPHERAFAVHTTATPLLEQKVPEKLSALKDITLDLMDPTKDHLYSGHVISLTIMEDPIMTQRPGVHTVVRDDSFNFQRCYFYNWKKEDRMEKFLFGTKISVTNPYFRLTIDQCQGIRVEDPRSVIFHGRDESLCRFCGKSGATKHCARCKRAFYCSKECQIEDCKLLKHKNICNPQVLQKL